MKNNGITLIALIITIIVLLILAGISVGMLRTDNGILKQSRNAKESTNASSEIEKIQLGVYSAESSDYSISSGNIRTKELIEGLKSQFGNEYGTLSNNDDNYNGPWYYTSNTEKIYTIKANGKVQEGEVKPSFILGNKEYTINGTQTWYEWANDDTTEDIDLSSYKEGLTFKQFIKDCYERNGETGIMHIGYHLSYEFTLQIYLITTDGSKEQACNSIITDEGSYKIEAFI